MERGVGQRTHGDSVFIISSGAAAGDDEHRILESLSKQTWKV